MKSSYAADRPWALAFIFAALAEIGFSNSQPIPADAITPSRRQAITHVRISLGTC